jgi:hypothetical protein
MDALYEDDSHVWDCRITKIWGEKGQIIIGFSMTLDHFMQYQTESVKRQYAASSKAQPEPDQTKQPKRAAA